MKSDDWREPSSCAQQSRMRFWRRVVLRNAQLWGRHPFAGRRKSVVAALAIAVGVSGLGSVFARAQEVAPTQSDVDGGEVREFLLPIPWGGFEPYRSEDDPRFMDVMDLRWCAEHFPRCFSGVSCDLECVARLTPRSDKQK